MKVAMVPSPDTIEAQRPSGITTIVRKYTEYLPSVGIEIVEPDAEYFDVAAAHASVAEPPSNVPFVEHCHGLYWSAHYNTERWEELGNRHVIENVRAANAVTVPSEWVAETFRRDMHLSPFVVPHGVDISEWRNRGKHESFVIWNKNRTSDVCSPKPLHELAKRRPKQLFLTTFTSKEPTPNIKVTGLIKYDTMREIVKISGVYLATVEETFGIGTLEAMAAGVPILGFNHGGTAELVEHGVNGYLARPGDYDDLAVGLDYCLAHAKILGENGVELAKKWTWESVAKKLRTVYEYAIENFNRPHTCTVVIPCYNKAATLKRAVLSALAQITPPREIIIVDNNSTDDSAEIATSLASEYSIVKFVTEERQGVAHARNRGVSLAKTRYICCLDADDEILPGFLEACISTLRSNPELGIAYTKIEAVTEDGKPRISAWPSDYDFDAAAKRQNQVPTCCVFRKDVFDRLGGYRQRYAPDGAGAEDAELWYRFGECGYGGALATDEALFRYYLGGAVSGNVNYREVDYLAWHPEVMTGEHHAASLARPKNNIAHPVRKYNQPSVAVIIPVSQDHLAYLYDALDSVEGQTFPNWEAIVVFDFQKGEFREEVALATAYPFVRFIYSDGRGPGACRNLGVTNAKANRFLFLDADDWLEPNCLEVMVDASASEPDSVIYSDYYGRAYGISDPASLEREGRLVHYEQESGYAVMRYFAAEYDCENALRQPLVLDNGQFYIWNLITSLTPRSAHDAIGGFDEEMESWEDWDYWLRMARAGICFSHVHQHLVSYRFYTGTRRDIGRQLAGKLIDYLRNKYEGDIPVPCGGCSKRRANPVMVAQQEQPIAAYTSNDMVRVEFMSQSFGEPITMRDLETNQLHDYGFRKGGDTFMMLRKHAERYPDKFRIIDDVTVVQAEEAKQETVSEPPPPPEPIKEPAPKKKRQTRKRGTRSKTVKSSSS